MKKICLIVFSILISCSASAQWWNVEQSNTTTTTTLIKGFDELNKGDDYFEKGDYSNAMYYWELAAEQNNFEALYKVTLYYWGGELGFTDYNKAFKYAKAGIEEGDRWAGLAGSTMTDTDKLKQAQLMCVLGCMYYYGDGTEKDIDRGGQLLEKSFNRGYEEARLNLGLYYIRIEDARAYQILKPEAEEGDKYAMRGLGSCYQLGLGVEKNYEMAAEWYKKAALKGESWAMYTLGMFYKFGGGVEKSEKKSEMAMEAHKLAEDGKENEAIEIIKQIIEN